MNAPSVDSFKNRLDKQWSNEEILYDYKAATPAGRKLFAPAGTQDLTIAGLEIYISRQWTIGPPVLEIWWSCKISGVPYFS